MNTFELDLRNGKAVFNGKDIFFGDSLETVRNILDRNDIDNEWHSNTTSSINLKQSKLHGIPGVPDLFLSEDRLLSISFEFDLNYVYDLGRKSANKPWLVYNEGAEAIKEDFCRIYSDCSLNDKGELVDKTSGVCLHFDKDPRDELHYSVIMRRKII